MVSIQWHQAMVDLLWPLNTGKVCVNVVGKPVAEARNECVARALGCVAEAVSGVETLRTALEAASDRQGPTLIEIDQRLWMEGADW